jgi:uncharacterized protein (TIGR00290 family)
MEENITKVVLNWSSGKDAALAYGLLNKNEHYKITHLLTTVSEEHQRIVMHGIREELLDEQAKQMGLPLKKIFLAESPDDDSYKAAMQRALNELKRQGVTTAAFGDIFLEDLKAYREMQLKQVGFEAVFPLWKKDTVELVAQLEQDGIEAMIVCVNEKFLGKEFLGKTINKQFLAELPGNVDPCGENGEFHTFVFNAPYFKRPVPIIKGETVYKEYMAAKDDKDRWNTGFYFLDLYLDK